jgi:hypothetical protein
VHNEQKTGEKCRLTVEYRRPVQISRADIYGNITAPALLDAEAVVQVKLAIDNAPCFRNSRRQYNSVGFTEFKFSLKLLQAQQ